MTTRGRETLREVMLRNQAAMDQLAAISGKPRVLLDISPEPAKRGPRKASGQPTEADVMHAVHGLLRVHPRVAWFMRLNSGAVQDGDRYTVFYRLYLRGKPGRPRGASDYLGQLIDGRIFLLECKRPSVKRGTDEQHELLDACVSASGIAGIVRSVEDAQALLA
jgi:hypothetical protein